MKRKELEEKLQTRFFIVGGGAWQRLWETDDKKPSMGFLPDIPDEEVVLSSKALKTSIQTELLKRFRSEVLVMQPMSKEDYQQLIPQFAQCLPAMRQANFIELAEQGVDTAVREQLGMRYFEEILTQSICAYMKPTLDK